MQRAVERMLKAHPEPAIAPSELLTDCIKCCAECAEVCTACADACVADYSPMLEHCVRLDQDCADICMTTVRVLSRQSAPDRALVAMQVELCGAACRACARECGRHGPWHAHCQICAAACERCAATCLALVGNDARDWPSPPRLR